MRSAASERQRSGGRHDPVLAAASQPGRDRLRHPASARSAPSAPARRRPDTPAAGRWPGKTVGIDPGHNGRNKDDPAYLNRMVWNGRARETCDTTGTESDSGYAEAAFNFAVATDLRADLSGTGPGWS